jgi:hypothetical protein
MSTPAQALASRTNALLSTGPKTAEGKATSRFNPLRHGLTSEHLIIPGENPEHFDSLLAELRTAWAPANPDEESLVSKLAEHEWRLMRARRVETASLSIYIERLMDEPEVDGSHDRALALVYERYGKELDRLRRYETTIRRTLDKTLRELENLVASREAASHQQEVSPAEAAWIAGLADEDPMPAVLTAQSPETPGFVSQKPSPKLRTSSDLSEKRTVPEQF